MWALYFLHDREKLNFFLLYINDLAIASKFLVSLFADDTCGLASHSDLTELDHLCNTELTKIHQWFLANRLTANLSKASKYMITLDNSRTDCSSFSLKMGITTLERVDSIKYLGVIFQENFKWQCHVKYLSNKLSRASGILSKLRYYVNTQTLLKVYHSLVGSHLNYSLLAWGSASQTTLQPLRVLQNKAFRFIARSPRFRRLDVDYLNLRLLKLDDMYKLSLAIFFHQYHHNNLPLFFIDFFPKNNTNHSYCTRSSSVSDYQVLHCKKASAEKSIRFKGPILWKSISSEIQSIEGKKLFKREYTKVLLATY